MMKFLLFLSVAMALAFSAGAQSAASENKTVPGQTSFFAELGGPGILFSANIDRRFKPSNLGWGGRIGVGFVTADEEVPISTGGYEYNMASVITIPVQVNYIFGKTTSPHTLEAGAGLTFVGKKLDIMNFYNSKKSNVFGTFSFMYRRQPVDGGFSWRIGFSPLVARGYIQPFGAVGVGYNF